MYSNIDYNKHAYLILAHKDDYTFYSLLRMLDYEKNDIFIHMDIKNKSFDESNARGIVKKSNVFFSDRTCVTWGGYSQINAELIILKCALSHGKYLYYHLLSGQDLPIKSQEYIHSFFRAHIGTEFVRFESNYFEYPERVRYYYFLQDILGRKISILAKGLKAIQMVFGINRNKNIEFQKGANWFSITDNLAKYVVSKEKWIKKVFRYTTCCDEVFLQTLIVNSDFKNKLVKSNYDDSSMFMRLIDWKRGKPYVFRNSDRDELEKSDMLFARKFSSEIDKDIIDWVAARFTSWSE